MVVWTSPACSLAYMHILVKPEIKVQSFAHVYSRCGNLVVALLPTRLQHFNAFIESVAVLIGDSTGIGNNSVNKL